MGDWNVSPELFPSGLESIVQQIRSCGMIPGIWFELENCGPLAEAYTWERHLLQRDGIPITSGQRRFWNFRDPFVIEYLSEKVIDFIKKYDFGYLKVDYNETIGIGCDGAESLGEGLRLQMEAVQNFFRRIRREIPHLVEIRIPTASGFQIGDVYSDDKTAFRITRDILSIRVKGNFIAAAVLLTSQPH